VSAADPELTAMAEVDAAVRPLDDEAIGRVLRWAFERHGVTVPSRGTDQPEPAQGEPTDIAELFASAKVTSNPERALLAAYWFQRFQASKSFTGQQLNSELKQMGIGLSNVTHALNRLIGQSPSLIQQLSKSGRTKQARKQYRLTTAGLEAAASLLQRDTVDGLE
jgi:hypothetical protein